VDEKSPSAIRRAHGPEQSRRAALPSFLVAAAYWTVRFIPRHFGIPVLPAAETYFINQPDSASPIRTADKKRQLLSKMCHFYKQQKSKKKTFSVPMQNAILTN
jgi:hypothetical protein